VTFLAVIALLGWVPLIVIMYAFLPARLVSAIAVVGAWLLLPPASISIAGFPDYSKNTAATTAMVLGTLLFAPDRIIRFRPRWFDLPMLAWCLCGIASSLENGLGPYDGLSDALRQFLTWISVLTRSIALQRCRGLARFVHRHGLWRSCLCATMPLGGADEPQLDGSHLRP